MIPPQSFKFGTIFHLMCPGQDDGYQRVIITKDGTVRGNLKYKDYCPHTKEAADQKRHESTIAYNNDGIFFQVHDDTNTMKEFSLWLTLFESEKHHYNSRNWEILKMFFDNYNINPTWINCHYTWGWFDEETGKWTGAVGKV